MSAFLDTLSSEVKEKLVTRIQKVNHDIKCRGILTNTSGGKNLSFCTSEMLTGYCYGEFYDWDLYFENIYLSYFGISKFCRTNVEVFLDTQLECGFISRTIVNPRMRQHFKPFLAQICVLGSNQFNNWVWLKDKYYIKLKKYLDYWFWFCDFDKNGLSVWDSADHSGMDNQNLRAGVMNSQTVEGVDLACYLYRELIAMSVIAKHLDLENESQDFVSKAEELKHKINDYLWDEEDGFYYDRHERDGELIKFKSASSFAVLWAGVAPPDRAEKMIQHLVNPEEFWIEYPIASWARNQTGYYQQKKEDECTWMGSTWVCINYMVMHGLMRYGYKEIAESLAQKTFHMVLNEEDTREYYNGETGIGQGLNPFWGWSTLAYFMPLEMELGYDPTNLHETNIKKLCDLFEDSKVVF